MIRFKHFVFFSIGGVILVSNSLYASPISFFTNTNTLISFSLVDDQQKTIVGRVVDGEGHPIPGATITVKGANISASTDSNGRFKIDILPGRDLLIVTSVGYQQKEISIGSNLEFDITLESVESNLDEVVVVGFGSQKKKSVVSSISTIKGEQMRMPNRSLSNNLAGQVAGLIAVQRSGEPGYDNAEFWIRGVSSFAGGTNPLVLVDGVPRDMNDIEPDEIETFSLLKDAAATSVYGSEGANGVILITSKRGRIQRPSIAYRGEASRLTPTRIPRFANSADFLTLYNEVLMNDEGVGEFMSKETIAKYASGEDPDLYPNVDWWSTLMKDHTSNTRHTLNFRGGSEKVKYFVSGAYFGESGLYVSSNEYNNNAGLKRYNLRSNIDMDVSKTTLLSVDLSGQYLNTNYPKQDTYGLIRWFTQTPPYIVPNKYSDGTLASSSGVFTNPYNLLVESGYRKEWRTGIQSKVTIDQKFDFLTKGLKAKLAVSYDSESQYNMQRSKTPAEYYATGRDPNGNLIFSQVKIESPLGDAITSNSGNKNVYLEGSFIYNRTFEKHDVGGMFLYYQKDRQLHNNALAFRKQAWVGRATYGFDNRYHVEANFSVTGSEQFASGYRYGVFPALGLGWTVSNEPFFGDSFKDVVSDLKLRFSIGRTGNDNTGGERFLYRPSFGTTTGYSWGIGSTGTTNPLGGVIEGRFEAPYLSWEIEMKRNYGVDLSLMNNMVTLQADYFNNQRSNILLQRKTVSGVAGFRQDPWQNFGVVNNKGVDASLNFYKQFGEFKLALRGNFTFARNKIIEFDEVRQPYAWMNQTGTRLNSLRGLVADRLFRDDDFDISEDNSGKKTYDLREGLAYFTLHPNPQPGDIKYVDQNKDGVIDLVNDVIQDYANPTVPEIIYGFGTNLDYAGFYLNVFFQGAGNVTLNLNNQPTFFMPYAESITSGSVRQEIIESRWTAENPSQDVFFPRISIKDKANTNSTLNTWWYRDASFIRLKNVEMGYNFKSDLLDRWWVKAMRVYVTGQNVALWDKVHMFDPETGNNGAGTQYPLPSTWTVGLDFTF